MPFVPGSDAADPMSPRGAVAASRAANTLILRSTNLLTPEFGHFDATRITLLLYALHRLSATLVCVGTGPLVDRIGATRPLAAGAAVLLLAYAGFAFAPADIVVLALCFVGAGLLWAAPVILVCFYCLVGAGSDGALRHRSGPFRRQRRILVTVRSQTCPWSSRPLDSADGAGIDCAVNRPLTA